MYASRSFKNNGAHLIYTRGGARAYGNRNFGHTWYIRGVVCADGRRRTVFANTDASQYRVKIKGIWYHGTVSAVEINDHDDLMFYGYSTFQKIAHGWVVRYWLERQNPDVHCELSLHEILNRCTRQTGIKVEYGQIRLWRNGKVIDAVQAPRWITSLLLDGIMHGSTYGELVAIMKDEGVK